MSKLNYSVRAAKVKESTTLAIAAKAKAMKARGESVISFTVGEPDFDTPAHIVEAAKKAMDEGFTKYTDSSGIIELREAICKKLSDENGLNYSPAQIVVSNGAKHSISNVCAAILNEGDEVLIPAPYWLTYPEIVALSGGVPVVLTAAKATDYKISPAQIEAAITSKTKALFINSPNNPSGAVYTESELRGIADMACKHNLIVISDEIYEHLIYEPGLEHISIASFNDDIKNRTVVINGLSKSYAMTGWRMGYTASNAELAKLMSNIQSHQTSNICSITQKASIAALLGDKEPLRLMRAEFSKRRDYVSARLMGMGFKDIAPPAGAFYVLIDCKEDAGEYAARLLDKTGVVVVPCADFGLPNHIRVSYAASMGEIAEGMNRLEKFVKG